MRQKFHYIGPDLLFKIGIVRRRRSIDPRTRPIPQHMIEHSLDTANAILHVRPQSALQQADFEQLSHVVDPFISGTGDLAGLIIETPAFPGWSSFGAFVAHMRFVKDHHKHIKRIALVTDSALGNIGEHLVSHFVSAEIRQFPASAADAATQWILGHP